MEKMKEMKRISKFLSWLLIVTLLLCNIPSDIIVRAGERTVSKVRVIVRNDTYLKTEGGRWDGKLIDKWVEVENTDTAITAVSKAIKEEGFTQTGADSGYITEINGLSAYDGGSSSGWMGTLNDWFTTDSLTNYKVSDNSLQNGDEICFWYTCNWGSDLGSVWGDTNTTLKSLSFSNGRLDKEFDALNKEYTLLIDGDSENVTIDTAANNKNFQVRTYKNVYQPTVKNAEFKKNDTITISAGDKIYIGVGNTNWPSMNSGQTETLYTINVKKAESIVEKPHFEKFNFMSSALTNWITDETFANNIYEYNVNIKAYSTSTLSITSTTKYDTEKYTATALYKDINGEDRNVVVASGKLTSLTNIPFGTSQLEIRLTDLTDSSNYTIYKYNITRPYDVTSQIKAGTGIVIVPDGRELLSTNYQGKPEGTIFKTDSYGEITTSGVVSDYYTYQSYLLENLESFSLKLTGKTAYVHIRISEDGKEYIEVENGGNSSLYSFGEKTEKNFVIQTISDEEYLKNGFENVDTLGSTYSLKVIKADVDIEETKITSAATKTGDWYPEFSKDNYSYSIIIENDEEMPELAFTTSDNAIVKLGTNDMEKDEDGQYHISLKTSVQTINVSSKNGVVNIYSFKVVKKSKYDVPDKVTDYLCINSQYTNSLAYGSGPEATLSGTMRSLGNYGGYVTYYYEDAIKNNPNNKYGVDFYVYGNSFASGGSSSESGQVWVSEDGEKWYALAGSEHYEDSTITDYEITYRKTADGKTSWTDNQGGSNDGETQSGAWPLSSVYYMNKSAKEDTITLKGILLSCADGSLYGDGSTASYAGEIKFGYVDYFKNGTIGLDVNPYTENADSNGFDIEWAVDEEGNRVELNNGIHYIKVVTASNIWAGSFREKSTEVSYVVRTAAAEESVGKTQAPKSILITDENGVSKEVKLEEDKTEYDVKLNDVSNVSISLKDVTEEDNIYINNKRIADGESANISVNEDGRKVRVIVQNGEKEPVIYILNLVSESIEKTNNIFNEVTDRFVNDGIPVVGSIGGEWKVIGLARASKADERFAEEYFKNAYKYVKENGSAKLHKSKSSDNSRMILALTSLGYNVKNICGYNLLEPLADFDYVVKQGVNGAIWALVAFDSYNYDIPVLTQGDVQTTRENLIEYIISSQSDDGGFSLDGTNSDIDLTAMAIQALSSYYNSDEKVTSSITKAVDYLTSVQNEDGSFGSYGTENCESTAQVVIALSSLGINSRTDTRFIKNGISAITALNNFYVSDGSFSHSYNENMDEMATEQAYLGLVSYMRLLNDDMVIYDMSDVKQRNNPIIDSEDNNSNNNDNNNTNDNNANKDNNNVNDKAENQNSNKVQQNNSNEALPKTGDYTNILLYMLMMTVSGAGIFVIYRVKRKKA